MISEGKCNRRWLGKESLRVSSILIRLSVLCSSLIAVIAEDSVFMHIPMPDDLYKVRETIL